MKRINRKVLKVLVPVLMAFLLYFGCATLFGPARRSFAGSIIQGIEGWELVGEKLKGEGHIAVFRPEKKDSPVIEFYTTTDPEDTGCEITVDNYTAKIISGLGNVQILSDERANLGGLDAKRTFLADGDTKIVLTVAMHWQRPYWLLVTSNGNDYEVYREQIQQIASTVRFSPLNRENREWIKRECSPFGEISSLSGININGSLEDWNNDKKDDGIAVRIDFLNSAGAVINNWYNTRYIVSISLKDENTGNEVYSDTRYGLSWADFAVEGSAGELTRIPAGKIKGGYNPVNGRGKFTLEVSVETEKQGTFTAVQENSPDFSVLRSGNANLTGVDVTAGSFEPAFSSAHTEYLVSAPNESGEITLSPVLADTASKKLEVNINGKGWQVMDWVKMNKTIQLQVGIPQTVVFRIYAENDKTKEYSLTVIRQKSSDARLSGIETADNFELSPIFTPDVTEYNMTINRIFSDIVLTPAVSNKFAVLSIRVNESKWVTAKGADKTVKLRLDSTENTVELKVAAQDGTENIYRINIQRTEEWTLGGKITVADAAFWDKIKVGVIYLGMDASQPNYYDNIKPSTSAPVKISGDHIRVTTVRYRGNNDGSIVEVPVSPGEIMGTDPISRDFKLKINTSHIANTSEGMVIVAWYDEDMDDNWDVIDSINSKWVSNPIYSYIAMEGSEYIQIPVIADYKDATKKKRDDIGLGSIYLFPGNRDKAGKSIFGFHFSSFNSTWGGSNNSLKDLSELQNLQFTFYSISLEDLAAQNDKYDKEKDDKDKDDKDKDKEDAESGE